MQFGMTRTVGRCNTLHPFDTHSLKPPGLVSFNPWKTFKVMKKLASQSLLFTNGSTLCRYAAGALVILLGEWEQADVMNDPRRGGAQLAVESSC